MPKNTQAVPSTAPTDQKKQAVPSTAPTDQKKQAAPTGATPVGTAPQAQTPQQKQPVANASPTSASPYGDTEMEQERRWQPTGTDSIGKALEAAQQKAQQITAQQVDRGAMETAAHTDTQPTQTGTPQQTGTGPGNLSGTGGKKPFTEIQLGGDSGTPAETPRGPGRKWLEKPPKDLTATDDDLGGGGGGGGDGTGTTPTEEKPTIDTEETLEDPYSKTIEDYQTEVRTYIDDLKAMTEADLAAYAEKTGMTIDEAKAKIDGIIADLEASMPEGKADRVGRVDTVEEESLLDQLRAAQEEQAKTQIDYAVKTGVDELTRAEEDAQSQFQTMRDQIAANERQALDNQALYAEARGDKGGIGQAQYGSIQNTAATNQLTVNRQQTQLATDTARQIADLRSKGEFEKADKLLSISQEYLSKLMQLKQWADETNVSIDEFNIGVQQWEQEYQAKLQQTLADLQIGATQWGTGLDLDREGALLDAQLDLARMDTDLNISLADKLASMQLDATRRTEEKAADAAKQMIQLGLQPTDEQLKAIGWTKDQYDAYQAALEKAQQGTGSYAGPSDDFYASVQDMIETGMALTQLNEIYEQAKASKKHDATELRRVRALIDEAERGGYQGKVTS